MDTADITFRVRQEPGEDNSLGLVKFMFPNRFSVYLHDTPSHALFDRSKRTLSHGCVRVEKPVELARYVLDGQEGWNDEEDPRGDGGTTPRATFRRTRAARTRRAAPYGSSGRCRSTSSI